jgi:hypothetical protein
MAPFRESLLPLGGTCLPHLTAQHKNSNGILEDKERDSGGPDTNVGTRKKALAGIETVSTHPRTGPNQS